MSIYLLFSSDVKGNLQNGQLGISDVCYMHNMLQENFVKIFFFKYVGTIYGVLASVFVSLYAIFIKRILPVVDNNVWLLTFYNNVNAMLLFIPLMIVFGEFSVLMEFSGLFSLTFWILMTLGKKHHAFKK